MKTLIRTAMIFVIVSIAIFAVLPDYTNGASCDDASYRLTLRLTELGYITLPEALVDQEVIDGAIARFLESNSSPADIFSPGAKPVWNDAVSAAEPVIKGQALPWETVREELLSGSTYVITNSGNGGMLHARLISNSGGYAELTTSGIWDAMILKDYFSTPSPCPVVISIGSSRIAGALSVESGGVQEEEGSIAFRIYFDGAYPAIGNIRDADAAAAISFSASPS